jgi:hypothetical protein
LLRLEYTWTTQIKSLKIHNKGLSIRRSEYTGSNPAALARLSLNRYKNSFSVKVISRGVWIGIGVADSKFILHHSSTLGTQTCGINSAFFCQDSTLLQLNTSKRNIVINNIINSGDIIKVEVDFELSSIYYYRNGNFEGVLVSSVQFKENTLFPCCNLSDKTEVKLLYPKFHTLLNSR